MADSSVLAALLRTASRLGASPKERKALIEAGIVESGLRNLNYGDRDSLGVLQQRPSQGWGTSAQVRDPVYAATQFLTRAKKANRADLSAGELAQAVQRSAFPARYDAVGSRAERLLGGSRSAGGSSGSQQVNVSASVPQAAPSFDPGQAASTLQGLLTQQVPPPVQVPQAPHGVVQAPVVNPQPSGDGIGALLAAAATPAQGLPEMDTASAATVKVTGTMSRPTGTAAAPASYRGPKYAKFDGKTVAGWIAPALEYARKHGWKGTVNEGLRSNETQAQYYSEFQAGKRRGPVAAPGTSHHRGVVYPLGAVDVSNPDQLSAILRRSPFANKLVWAGSKDRPHFSHPFSGGY